jgi:hypothetical protein
VSRRIDVRLDVSDQAWFGPAGFGTVVTGFTAVFLISFFEHPSLFTWGPWLVLEIVVPTAMIAVPCISRQIGIGILLSWTAILVRSSVYVILAFLVFAGPFLLLCALVGGVPYLIWRRRTNARSQS